jgi:hypothetical protein
MNVKERLLGEPPGHGRGKERVMAVNVCKVKCVICMYKVA